MKLFTITHKQVLKRYNYYFGKDVKIITLKTGIQTKIQNGIVTVL